MTIAFDVLGIPRPQGSMALFRAKSGHEVAKYSDTVYEWRRKVTAEALQHAPAAPLDEPLRLVLVFDMPRPKSHFGTGRNEGKLKPSAPALPVTGADLDKLVRAVGDAITDAGIWRDDVLVVELDAVKRYADNGDVPGVSVRIEVLK